MQTSCQVAFWSGGRGVAAPRFAALRLLQPLAVRSPSCRLAEATGDDRRIALGQQIKLVRPLLHHLLAVR